MWWGSLTLDWPLRRPSPQAFTCFIWVRHPILEEYRWGLRHFWNQLRIWASGFAQFPTLKWPYATFQLDGVLDEYQNFSHSLASTLLVQSDSVIILGKTVLLQITTIFHLSYFLFNFGWNEIFRLLLIWLSIISLYRHVSITKHHLNFFITSSTMN